MKACACGCGRMFEPAEQTPYQRYASAVCQRSANNAREREQRRASARGKVPPGAWEPSDPAWWATQPIELRRRHGRA